jgi:hypothetical protein
MGRNPNFLSYSYSGFTNSGINQPDDLIGKKVMTIAQQLKVTKFPFVIKNDAGKEIYFEDSDGWWKKREWDDKGEEIYYEDSDGYWIKYEYDERGNEIYWENSDGIIRDNRRAY